MVADVKFQLKCTALLNHLFNDSELMFIQLDVRQFWQDVEIALWIIQHFAVVEHTDRNSGGLDKAQSTCLCHFLII